MSDLEAVVDGLGALSEDILLALDELGDGADTTALRTTLDVDRHKVRYRCREYLEQEELVRSEVPNTDDRNPALEHFLTDRGEQAIEIIDKERREHKSVEQKLDLLHERLDEIEDEVKQLDHNQKHFYQRMDDKIETNGRVIDKNEARLEEVVEAIQELYRRVERLE